MKFDVKIGRKMLIRDFWYDFFCGAARSFDKNGVKATLLSKSAMTLNIWHTGKTSAFKSNDNVHKMEYLIYIYIYHA